MSDNLDAVRVCLINNCDRPHQSRGYCAPRYKRVLKHGDPLAHIPIREPNSRSAGESFERFVYRTDDCWYWTGNTWRGYGSFNTDGRTVKAHRWAYETYVGPIPKDLTIDHRCHNEDDSCAGGPTCPHRRCCNPDHLDAVPAGVNAKSSSRTPASINASKTHCIRGHELSGYNLVLWNGKRACRACRNEFDRRRRSQAKESA